MNVSYIEVSEVRQVMNRPEGWEGRLAAVLKEAETRPFDPREWNCALFARACAEAVSGRQLPTRISKTLPDTVDRLFPRVNVRLARRGDVVAAHLPALTLAVCTGAKMAAVGKNGLTVEPMSKAIIAWSV